MASVKGVKAADFGMLPKEVKAAFVLKGWSAEEAQKRIQMTNATFYRKLKDPKLFTLDELWKIAKATGKEIQITEKGVTLV